MDEKLNSGSSIVVKSNNVSYYGKRDMIATVSDEYGRYADHTGIYQSQIIFPERG